MPQTSLMGHFTRSSKRSEKSNTPVRRKRSSSPQYAAMSPPKRRRTRGQRASPPAQEASECSDSSDIGDVKLENRSDSEDVIGVEDAQRNTPSPSKRSQASPKRRRLRRHDSDDEHDTETELEEETVLAFHTRPGRKPTVNKSRSRVLDSDDEDAHVPQRSSFLKERPATPEEDLEDEVDEKYILDNRLRGKRKKTAKELTLEKLKRKRRGDSSPIIIPSDDEPNEDSDGHSGGDDNDDDVEIVEGDVIPGARPKAGSDDSDATDDSESAFIVEDDNALDSYQLPAEFSMDSHQDLMHHFKIVCQMFVHAALSDDREAFMHRAMNNQYFSVPLQATRKKLLGLRDSLVASSMWKDPFKRPLLEHPDLSLNDLDFTLQGCDACQMGGRKSSKSAFVSGNRYDPLTYEVRMWLCGEMGGKIEGASQPILDSAGSSSDSEDDDFRVRNGKSRSYEFNLGRFCAERTRVFHKFNHWEYHLFHNLLDEVNALHKSKSRGFISVAFSGGRAPPADPSSDPDGVVDWLDQRRVIEILYGDVKDMMESARHLEMRVKKGDDDG